MSIDNHVSVTIDKEIASLTRAGFGVPLIAAYHTVQPGRRVLTYDAATALADMAADGFLLTSSAYLMAQSLLSQDPAPSTFKVGRRAGMPVHTVRITPKNITQGFIYKFTVDGTEIEYTVLASSSVSIICTALQVLIDALSGVACANNTTHLTLTAQTGVGDPFSVVSKHLHSELGVEVVTADPGLAADLVAIESEDAAWYGLLLDSAGAAEILIAAAFAEARNIQFVANVFDSECKDSTVTDCILSALRTTGYVRTIPIWSENWLQAAGAAWMGNRFPFDPGSDTWAYKQLAGVTVSTLRSSERNAIINKGGNFYYEVAGASVTYPGKSAQGEFADITRFVDWLHARIQEDVFGELVARQKIPYTDKGAAILVNRVQARLQDGVDVGGLADDPRPIATAKKVLEMSVADRAGRIAPDITFSGRLAGAIHTVGINGKVSV
jgi:hypothetical protein